MNNFPSFYNVAYTTKSNIDVFRAGLKLLIASEGDSGLQVGIDGHGVLLAIDFRDEFLKPDGSLGGMSRGGIFCFSGREGGCWSAFRAPGDSATVNKKGKARGGVVSFVGRPIGIGVARDGGFLLAVDQPVVSNSPGITEDLFYSLLVR